MYNGPAVMRHTMGMDNLATQEKSAKMAFRRKQWKIGITMVGVSARF